MLIIKSEYLYSNKPYLCEWTNGSNVSLDMAGMEWPPFIYFNSKKFIQP